MSREILAHTRHTQVYAQNNVNMAALDTARSLDTKSADHELSDEDIEQLLARATARLQQNPEQHLVKKRENTFTFPKLNTGELEKPYLQTKGDVASVDGKRLLEERHRKQANGIRKVEDPVAAKKVALEVCLALDHLV